MNFYDFLNPELNPKLIPTLSTLTARVISVMLGGWVRGLGVLVSPLAGWPQVFLCLGVFFGRFFSLLLPSLSHHHQNKPVTGFPAVYFSSLKFYKRSKSL